MPLFEYTCRKCSRRFEALVTGSSKPICPECGGRRLEKHLSVFAAHTKGRAPAPAKAAPSRCPCGDPRGSGSCELD